MTNKQKIINAIGLAVKANKYSYGQRLLDEIKENKVNLVILPSDMGPSQHKKFSDKCSFYNVKVLDNLVTLEELNKVANNKNQISAIGITDVNIKKLIMSYI